MEFSLAYRVVEAILMSMHDIPEDQRGAFRARLRLFKRLGFPPGVNTGKGKHVRYGAGEITLLALALEFIELGQTSEQAVCILRRKEELIRESIRKTLTQGAGGESIYFMFDPVALKDGSTFFQPGTFADLERIFGEGIPRVAIVNLSAVILASIRTWFSLLEGSEIAFRRALEEWANHGPEVKDVD